MKILVSQATVGGVLNLGFRVGIGCCCLHTVSVKRDVYEAEPRDISRKKTRR